VPVDPSGAEFSRRRRKIWSRGISAEKNSAGRKYAGKTKFGRRRIFLRPIFGGGAKTQLRRLARVGVAKNRLRSHRMIDYSHHM